MYERGVELLYAEVEEEEGNWGFDNNSSSLGWKAAKISVVVAVGGYFLVIEVKSLVEPDLGSVMALLTLVDAAGCDIVDVEEAVAAWRWEDDELEW